MNSIIKNQVLKSTVAFITITFLMIGLLHLTNTNATFSLLVMYGCTTTSVLTLKIGFLVFVILIQYFNADVILYHIKNIDYLCIRYGSKKKILQVLLGRILFCNLILIIISLLSTSLSLFVIEGTLTNLFTINTPVIVLRGFGNCFFFSIIQLSLLLFLDEAKCFAILILASLAITFFNPLNLPCSFELVGPKLIFWGVFYILICILTIFVLKILFEKEWGNYANRSI